MVRSMILAWFERCCWIFFFKFIIAARIRSSLNCWDFLNSGSIQELRLSIYYDVRFLLLYLKENSSQKG